MKLVSVRLRVEGYISTHLRSPYQPGVAAVESWHARGLKGDIMNVKFGLSILRAVNEINSIYRPKSTVT